MCLLLFSKLLLFISQVVELFELLVGEDRLAIAAGGLAGVADGASGVVHSVIGMDVDGCTRATIGLLSFLHLYCLAAAFIAVLGVEWVRVGGCDAFVRRRAL